MIISLGDIPARRWQLQMSAAYGHQPQVAADIETPRVDPDRAAAASRHADQPLPQPQPSKPAQMTLAAELNPHKTELNPHKQSPAASRAGADRKRRLSAHGA